MRQTAILTSTLFLISAAAQAADPQLLNLIPSDAKIVAGVNVLQAKATPFGNYVLSQITSNSGGLPDFAKATGFDPTKDVSEILAAKSDMAGNDGLLVARGTFNTASIVAAAIQAGSFSTQTYAGATLITSTDKGADMATAFFANSIAVVGPVADVKAALDRRTKANSLEPSLAASVNKLSTTQDAWTISVASLAGLLPAGSGAGQQLAIFKNILQSSGGVKFGANVELTAQATTSDPKDASALGDVIKFVAQLVAMNAGKDANAAEAATALQAINVTTSGTTVNISLAIPEATVEGLAKSMISPTTGAKAKVKALR